MAEVQASREGGASQTWASLKMFFLRSMILRRPPGSQVPTSPVCSHPSLSSTSSVFSWSLKYPLKMVGPRTQICHAHTLFRLLCCQVQRAARTVGAEVQGKMGHCTSMQPGNQIVTDALISLHARAYWPLHPTATPEKDFYPFSILHYLVGLKTWPPTHWLGWPGTRALWCMQPQLHLPRPSANYPCMTYTAAAAAALSGDNARMGQWGSPLLGGRADQCSCSSCPECPPA